METKRGFGILSVFLILFVLIVLLVSSYFLYLNFPGKPRNLTVIIEQPKLESSNLSYEIKQFYPNMKFNHNSISYSIDTLCSQEKEERMIEAFNELSRRVEVISFYPVSVNPDIEVSCSEDVKHSIEKDYFIAGEGGAKEIIQTGKYNVITNGIILLYGKKKSVECNWPNIELHELLHVFGFEHSKDKKSLMYPYLESCEQEIDESIINDLKKLYSQKNLADLYFESAEAVKKGRYLDFNISIKNSGVVDAKNVNITIVENGRDLDDFDLGKIPFGGGVNFYVNNLKLRSRNSKDILIIIDKRNLIKEFDKRNNIAELKLE